ncbi:MAG: hypothetical protein IPN48_08170 [Sphingomonadales bacterium]|nr:hypothetical protein [Sphingomonadales bacterium]
MTIEGHKFYPGEEATPEQVLRLANEYELAARQLAQCGRRGEPLSRSPFRLLAIHAIELYLNAFLLAAGQPAGNVRGLQHDLFARAELASAQRLQFRKRTTDHLRQLSRSREYLLTRYDPLASGVSELNRLMATLTETSEKVTAWMNAGKVNN